MDYKYIDQLLERYWQCLTTLEEERILRAFFEQDDVPAHLLQWREWFVYPQEALHEETLSDDFEQRMLALVDEPPVVKARTVSLRRRLRPFTRAAAVVAIVLTLGNALQLSLNKGNGNDNVGENDRTTTATMAKNDSIATDTTRHTPLTEVMRLWRNSDDVPQLQ